MSLTSIAQTGILDPIPTHARYLMCQHRPGTDAREVLKALAEVMPNDPALIEAYRAATRAMASQHDRSQAEQALDRFHRS